MSKSVDAHSPQPARHHYRWLVLLLRLMRRNVHRSLSTLTAISLLASSVQGAGASIAAKEGGTSPVAHSAKADVTSSLNSGTDEVSPTAKAEPANRPLVFERNEGQVAPSVRFLAQASGATVFFTPGEVVLALQPAAKRADTKLGGVEAPITLSETLGSAIPADVPVTKPVAARLQWTGASPAPQVEAGELLPGKVHYFKGDDPAKWHTDISTYESIRYAALYPGIDLSFDGTNGQLKSTYVVAPGGDPTLIRWRYEGIDQVSVDGAGNLQVQLDPAGGAGTEALEPLTVTEKAPVAWQVIGGQHTTVDVRYEVGLDGTVSFKIGAYDRTQPLTLDPELIYSTYLGGSGTDQGWGVGVDGAGNIYMVGQTNSVNFPRQDPIYQDLSGGYDVFVTKFDPTGSSPIYSTYLGGTNNDYGTGIAVDAAGNAYLTGSTNSTNFPTVNPLRGWAGFYDLFITKLNPSGSGIVYSTYWGGANNNDQNGSIAIDAQGNAYITGEVYSTDFPMVNAIQGQHIGVLADAVVVKINAQGSAPVYSTYLGSTRNDGAYGIAVDSSGSAYVTGIARGDDFPTTTGVFQRTYSHGRYGGPGDAFLTKVNAAGTAWVYSTYYGSGSNTTGEEVGIGIAVDSAGNAYIAGYTDETALQLRNPIQPLYGGGYRDAFVAKFNSTASNLVYGTYLGASDRDEAWGLAVDAVGSAFVTGFTASTNFRVANAIQPSHGGGTNDVFVTKVNAQGTDLTYSTFLGGNGDEQAYDVKVGSPGKNYVVGMTGSSNFPVRGAYQPTNAGGSDAFLTIEPDLSANAPESREVRCGGSPSQRPTTLEAGDGVNTATGYFCHQAVDLAIPGRGASLLFGRSYSSDMAASPTPGPLGYGWTHSYNMWLERQATAPYNYYVYEENGNVVTFDQNFSHEPRVLATLSYSTATSEYQFTRIHGQIRYFFKEIGSGSSRPIKLVRIMDRNNYATSLSYDSQKRVQTVTEHNGRQLQFVYDSANDPNSPINYVIENIPTHNGFAHTNRKVDFTITNGELRYAQFLEGTTSIHTTEYTYEGNHLLDKIYETRDEQRTWVVDNAYDANGRVTGQQYPMGRSMTFDYTGPIGDFKATTTNALQIVTEHHYIFNKISQVVELPGAEEEGTWDYVYEPGKTWVKETIDPNNQPWSYTWDDNGNMRTSTDPLGRTWEYTYTSLHEVDVVTSPAPDHFTVDYDYDSAGNLTQIKRFHRESQQWANIIYNRNATRPDEIDSITDQRGKVWGFTYDTYGYPNLAKNPPPFDAVEYTDSDYDGAGRLRRVVNPNNRAEGRDVEYQYNAYNEVTKVIDPYLKETTYGYDPIGNRTSVTDPLLNTVTYRYNLNNEVRRVTQADGTYSETFYDEVGRIDYQTNGLRVVIADYTYDDINRAFNVRDALLRTTEYKYDPAGRLEWMRDPDPLLGKTHFFYYDDGQLQTVAYDDPSTPDVTYTYEARGLRKTMTDGAGVTTYDYDSLDRLIWTKVEHAAGPVKEVNYDYDLAGNITKITYPLTSDGGGRRFVRRDYDEANRLWKVYNFEGPEFVEFKYDPNGNLEEIDYPGSGSVKTVIGYDNANRVASMTHSRDTGTFLSVGYTRWENGLLKTSVEQNPGQPDQIHHTYWYDQLNRLREDYAQSTASAGNTTWHVDAASQIYQTVYTPSSGPDPVITTNYDYDDANQLETYVRTEGSTTTRNLSFDYSSSGNRLHQYSSGQPITNTYEYDQANRLVSFDGFHKGVHGVGEYTYNGDGLRMSKFATGANGTDPKLFTWDVAQGLPLLLQAGDANYVYGPGGMLLAQHTFGTIDPQAPGGSQPTKAAEPTQPDQPDSEFGPYYYLADQSGNIIMMVHGSGLIEARYSYDAYGNRTDDPDNLWPYNPFGYAGQYTDQESGLVYMRARYYDPATEQFISRDPALGASGQPYVYAGASPVNATDPAGTFWDWIPDAISIGWDIGDIFSEGLTWETGGTLALDVVTGIIPVIPAAAGWARRGGKAAAEVLSHADDVADGGRAATYLIDPPTGGTKVYRIWGKDSGPWGHSWTRIDPRNLDDPRLRFGLPDENGGRFVSEGYLKDVTGIRTRPAKPYQGRGGGLDELLIPDPENQVELFRVSGVNPEY